MQKTLPQQLTQTCFLSNSSIISLTFSRLASGSQDVSSKFFHLTKYSNLSFLTLFFKIFSTSYSSSVSTDCSYSCIFSFSVSRSCLDSQLVCSSFFHLTLYSIFPFLFLLSRIFSTLGFFFSLTSAESCQYKRLRVK